MRRFTIDVDQDVFAYLEAEANSRVETPNTVLRRKLFVDNPQAQLFGQQVPVGGHIRVGPTTPTVTGLPDLPPRTPAALTQILWVVHLARAKNRGRPEATADVARVLGVTPQTVNDKYGRQMGLTADRFDALLGDPSLQELERMLTDRFPHHQEAIQHVLAPLRPVATSW